MSLLKQAVFEIANLIPKGKVVYYGQVAELVVAYYDMFVTAQVIGWTLSGMKNQAEFQTIPWQRIVTKGGTIATHKLGLQGSVQQKLLEEEGIVFVENAIDMVKYGITTQELGNFLGRTHTENQTKL
jgi:alkylated DNA nucleotide flippase Atl1